MTNRPAKAAGAPRRASAAPWVFLFVLTTAIGVLSHAIIPLDREALRLAVLTSWVRPGFGAVVSGLLVVWVVGFLFFWSRRSSAPGSAPAWGRPVSIVLLLLLLGSIPFTSTDVFLYLAQASTWLDFADNPYVTPPSGNLTNPFLPLATWPHETAHYGPVGVLVASALYHPSLGPWGHLVLMRLFAVACLVGAFAIARRSADLLGLDPRPRDAALALSCPLLVLEVGGAAHNDAWIALLLTACIYALLRGWSGRALVLFAASVAIKYTTAILAPAIAVWLWQTHVRDGRPKGGLLVGAIVVAAGSVGLVALFGGPSTVLHGLVAASDRSTRSIPWLLQWGERASGGSGAVALWVTRLIVLGVAAGLARRLRKKQDLPLVLLGTYLAFLLLGAAWFQPWYLVPLVPLSLLVASDALRTLIMVFCGSAVLGLYAVYFAFYSFSPADQALMTLVTFGPVSILAVRNWRKLIP